MGFSFMLDRIVEEAPCLLDKKRLTEAIFRGIGEHEGAEGNSSRPVWEELEAIESLATARDPNFRKSEVKDIARAIAYGAIDWEEKLISLCQQVFPDSLTELNVCGGPLPFFAPSIAQLFNGILVRQEESYAPLDRGKPFTPILIGAGIIERVGNELESSFFKVQESALPLRFIDPSCLLSHLVSDPSLTEKAG
jgi:hypothetical protein